MKKSDKKATPPKQFGDYYLVNHEKLDRAVNGMIGREGKLEGGVGRDVPIEVVIAEYDKLGGLILDSNGTKLETGSFYDFENRKPRSEAKVKVKKEPTAKKGVTEENVGDAPKKKKRSPADE